MLVVFIVLICMGVVDLYLLARKRVTISQYIHKMFPKWLDAVIMIALLVLTWYVGGMILFTPIMAGVVIGHLFWHE